MGGAGHSDPGRLVKSALAVIDTEQQAVAALRRRIDERFVAACRLLLDCKGKTVVTGVGKSGHIARKLAATLASTGTPSFFLHPGEAAHGDIGVITRNDAAAALSKSGEAGELLALLPVIKRLGVPLLVMTGNPGSTLGRAAAVCLDASVAREACPLNLAPTASAAACLALGDALALAVADARGFGEEDFARSHPGGPLGRRLLLRVSDVMRTGAQVPRVREDAPLDQALLEMSAKGLGMTAVVTAGDEVAGIFTDGDLRRALDAGHDVRAATMAQVMTRSARTVAADALAAEVLRMMKEHRINALLVLDDAQRLAGALNMHDLLRAQVV